MGNNKNVSADRTYTPGHGPRDCTSFGYATVWNRDYCQGIETYQLLVHFIEQSLGPQKSDKSFESGGSLNDECFSQGRGIISPRRHVVHCAIIDSNKTSRTDFDPLYFVQVTGISCQSNWRAVTMSPSVENRAFRNSICYVIEEEPSCDMENDRICDSEEQIETEFKNSRNNLSQITANVRMCDNDDNVKYRNESDNKNLFPELRNFTATYDERRDALASTISVPIGRLPTSHRRTLVQQSTNKRSSTPSNDTFLSEQHQSVRFGLNLEIKSGNLVMIVQEQSHKSSSSISMHASSRTLHLCRYPVIVKIYRRSYEKYAIISRPGRNPPTPSIFLKLKHSRVTQSLYNPSHFVVGGNGPDTKAITFEASSPEMSSEWIEAFSQDFPVGSLNHNKHFQRSRDILFPRVNLQSTSGDVPSESTAARTFHYSHLMPILSESSSEDEVQRDISTRII